jgi:phosphate starvation-inducible membrane PsiE
LKLCAASWLVFDASVDAGVPLDAASAFSRKALRLLIGEINGMEVVFYLVILAIVIAMIVGNVKLAQSKGQSVGLWVVLGILFNPIALIIQYFLSGNKSA